MTMRAPSIIPVPDAGKQESTDLVRREPSEEERVFLKFCDHVDAHLIWKGLPPIASSEEERREKAMMYLLRSIEAYRWFTELVGGLDILEKLLAGSNKRREVTEASPTTDHVQVSRKAYIATRGGRKHGGR